MDNDPWSSSPLTYSRHRHTMPLTARRREAPLEQLARRRPQTGSHSTGQGTTCRPPRHAGRTGAPGRNQQSTRERAEMSRGQSGHRPELRARRIKSCYGEQEASARGATHRPHGPREEMKLKVWNELSCRGDKASKMRRKNITKQNEEEGLWLLLIFCTDPPKQKITH